MHTDEDLSPFNSFQFWQVPLPELDLSLLETELSAGSHTASSTKDLEAMETWGDPQCTVTFLLRKMLSRCSQMTWLELTRWFPLVCTRWWPYKQSLVLWTVWRPPAEASILVETPDGHMTSFLYYTEVKCSAYWTKLVFFFLLFQYSCESKCTSSMCSFAWTEPDFFMFMVFSRY